MLEALLEEVLAAVADCPARAALSREGVSLPKPLPRLPQPSL